ncbi:MAG: tyrosine--tRNA ligase [Flavobacteriaceae bacterium TMED184]|nr:MAG: tyrosine--tRNA ligase [Flavobacteriaceae bacterium TMED184]|tara:strand:+ start:4006 stop:5298 length:1293 start_codon:yes stop_codon:yes gene_type:complete
MKNFVSELGWRGMLHDITPDTEKFLLNQSVSGYIGFDPSADSLHIGSLVQIMVLIHFQRAGHRPIILLGGATGMIGDPSGKSNERNLLSKEILERNTKSIKKQLEKYLDFDSTNPIAAEIVNNYDWMKNFSLIKFSREIGKHITVNYMMSKDSVKKRLQSDSKTGMSFTEFTYQLIQGYDFLHLFKEKQCKIQMGGSDQWGNIVTGVELVRRKESGKVFALTCPLITKSDGSKFGKSEHGNIWLDKKRTSPYRFYQYWLNSSDDDSKKYIKIFTLLSNQEIENLTQKHDESPNLRILQKKIAEEITMMVHSKEDLRKVQKATEILFGKSTTDDLKKIDRQIFLDVFEGVPKVQILKKEIKSGVDIISALVSIGNFLSSKGEARRAIRENSISVNKNKVDENYYLTEKDLIDNRYILMQKGKKNYYIVEVT